jgi:glucokinase
MENKKMAKKKSKSKGKDYVVGVDLGGTKILAAVVDQKGKILGEAKRPTMPASDADEVVKRLAKTVRDAIKEARVRADRVAAVGVGAPAPVDPQTGFVFHAPNIPMIRDFPLGERLGGTLDVPVFVGNDVNVGTVGEHALGAGRGTQDMVGIFVGTGVGGGVIVDGRLRHGFRNSAGEVGHMVVGFKGQPDEPICGCGRRGCLEAYASRTAIERDIRAGIAAGRETAMAELLEEGGRDRMTSGLLAKALKQGDPLVVEVMEQVTTYLSVHVATIVNFFDPEMIVFGGGVTEALGERLLEPIRRDAPKWYIQEIDADKVRIVAAELGDYAGVLGAATIARQSLA